MVVSHTASARSLEDGGCGEKVAARIGEFLNEVQRVHRTASVQDAGELGVVSGDVCPATVRESDFGTLREGCQDKPGAQISRGFLWEIVHSDIGYYAYLHGSITIGNYVLMGQDVKIITSNHSSSDTEIPIKCQSSTKICLVVIEDDVWIGSNVTILPGVHVGKDAILGAGSVVWEDVPPYAVMAWNPANILRYRKPAEPVSSDETDRT